MQDIYQNMKALKNEELSGDAKLEVEAKIFAFFDQDGDGGLDTNEWTEVVYCA